ncbi:tetratricopeptide repeat protein [Rheinheimera mangrovi]|uniref:tetratricopeptide repeat protein n=1 Tax=Rheinheimera mangrovi TaxID=2498451 RepID=UPI000F8C7747|nr:hypothetical protein [Rheinheimera mangrovi]
MIEASHLTILLQLERYQQLAQHSEQLLSEAPQHQPAALHRIAAYLYSNNTSQALKACEDAQAFCFDHSDFWLLKAQALRLSNNDLAAEQAVAKGLALAPAEPDLMAEQALLHLSQQRLAQCKKVLDNLLAEHPFHKTALHTLAILFNYGCHRPDRARLVLKRLLQQHPADSDTAQLLARMNTPWQGTARLKQLLQLKPADPQLRQDYKLQQRLRWAVIAAFVLSLLGSIGWFVPGLSTAWLHALLLSAMLLSLPLGWHYPLASRCWLMLMFPLLVLQDMQPTVANSVAALIVGALYALALQWLLGASVLLWQKLQPLASWGRRKLNKQRIR